MPPPTGSVHDDHIGGQADLDTATTLLSEVGRQGDGISTAVLVDLYDAPDDLGQAALAGYADRHADHVRDTVADVAGLAPTARITLIGHSYGSVAAGRAAAGGVDVNALILLASPGIGQLRAEDLAPLSATPDHVCDPANGVFVARAPFDPITWPAGSALPHGLDPARPDFGARTFELNDVTTAPHDGSWVEGHSGYLAHGTRSLQNVARIVAGTAPTVPSPGDVATRSKQVDPPGLWITDWLARPALRDFWMRTDGRR